MLLKDLVAASRTVGATRSRRTKVDALAAALREAAPEHAGEVGGGGLDLLRRAPATTHGTGLAQPEQPPATCRRKHADHRAGAPELRDGQCGLRVGFSDRSHDIVDDLFARATAEEQDYLRKLV